VAVVTIVAASSIAAVFRLGECGLLSASDYFFFTIVAAMVASFKSKLGV